MTEAGSRIKVLDEKVEALEAEIQEFTFETPDNIDALNILFADNEHVLDQKNKYLVKVISNIKGILTQDQIYKLNLNI